MQSYTEDLSICNCRESSYYNQEVGKNNYCKCFVNNPALDYFIQALSTGMGYASAEGIILLEQSLQLGLSFREEVICRAMLGYSYIQIGGEGIKNKRLSYSEAVMAYDQDDKITKGIEQLEKALSIDSAYTKRFPGRYKSPFIEMKSLRFSSFYGLEYVYVFKSEAIKRKHGIASAISYLRERLKLHDHLPGTYMPMVYHELGKFYHEKGEESLAAIHFKKSADMDVCQEDMKDDPSYVEVINAYQENRDMAQHNLEVITTKLNERKKALKREIDHLRLSITDKVGGVGTTAYSLFIKGELKIEDKEVQEVVRQIKSIDEEINNLTHRVEEIKAQQPTGGFFSRLKDKVSSTAKTAKIQLDLKNQRKKKEQIMPILGEKLYSSHKKGVSTPSVLQQTWETVDELKEEIKHKEAEYSSLGEILSTLII